MIEVLFGESEAGAMKAAKNTVIAGKVDGPTSVWMAGKKKPPERENCGWIEGTASEVVCLNFLIWKKIIPEPVKEARLIGGILGENQLGVGDWWYAKRIDHFIQTGKIKIVEDSEKVYARTICLA